MAAAEEFRPGLIGWLVSIFLASGFGSLAADGVRHLILQASRKGADLQLLDRQCRYDTRQDPPMICEFYIENQGDVPTFVTSASLVGEKGGRQEWNMFFTTAPLMQWNEDRDRTISTSFSSLAIAEPHRLFMIGLPLPALGEGGREIGKAKLCFLRIEEKLLCFDIDSYEQELARAQRVSLRQPTAGQPPPFPPLPPLPTMPPPGTSQRPPSPWVSPLP